MATNNRISNLDEATSLFSFDSSFIPSGFDPNIGNEDDDVLFMVASSGVSNEKIKFKNLKKSILDTSVLLSGDQEIRGSKTFINECSFDGGLGVDSYTVEDYIYHKDDLDTYIQFESGKINFAANDSINIDVSGQTMNIDSTGSLSINTTSSSGALTVNGDGYFNNLYVSDDAGGFVKISSHPEESVNFTLSLVSGISQYNIDFPKTFESPPSVTLDLQGSGSVAVPYLITNVTNQNYTVNFASNIPNDSYKIHTLAKPTGGASFRQTKTISLVEDLASGQSSFEITYPEAFVAPPILSTSLESENFIVSYLISESTTSSFKVSFVADLPEDAKLHIHATR